MSPAAPPRASSPPAAAPILLCEAVRLAHPVLRGPMTGRLVGLMLLGLLAAGCGGDGGLRRALRTDFVAAAHPQDLAARYRVQHPDVLEVRVAGRAELGGRRAVRLEGDIDLGGDRVRVEGLPAPHIAARLAQRLRLPREQVEVRVAEHNSQSLYVFGGDGAGAQVVAYRGPETVLDLFGRMPALARQAEGGEVHVVRSHVADGKPPEVFRVDLRAILLRKDLQTNVQLEPFDRIAITQGGWARAREHLPPWAKRALGVEAAAAPAAPPHIRPVRAPAGNSET